MEERAEDLHNHETNFTGVPTEVSPQESLGITVSQTQLLYPPPHPPISNNSDFPDVGHSELTLSGSPHQTQQQATGGGMITTPTPASSFAALDTETIPIMPPPLREEPTLKEKLVERERQRRVETERARLKRQFALMSNGGGLVYESAATTTSNSSQVAVRENGSVAGTVGEESTVAQAELDDESQQDRQGGSSNQQLGYTMERFLLEGGSVDPSSSEAANAASVAAGASGAEVVVVTEVAAVAPGSPTTVIEEPNESAESNTPTDKGVVMERFLNEPVHVEPAAATETQEGNVDTTNINAHHVHRSVSFDMELHHQQGPASSDGQGEVATTQHGHSTRQIDSADILLVATGHATLPRPRSDDGLNVSLDSNASVKVQVADDLAQSSSLHSMDRPVSSSSGGPPDSPLASIDRQSSSSVTMPASLDQQPRVLRLTEAEIQEMAAIEEASIGNAPPSERRAESSPSSSLVGELVGEFPPGHNVPMTFSQGTPTTAMESVSIVSGGNQSGALVTSSDRVIIDQQSLDEVVAPASVSSHLVVSPGASVAGSAVSLTANPPSEFEAPPVLEDDDIISPVATLPRDVDVHNDNNSSNDGDCSREDDRKPPAVVENSIVVTNDIPSGNNGAVDLTPGPECIVNRQIRPAMISRSNGHDTEPVEAGMMETTSSVKRSTSLPGKMNEMVVGFDFDKHDEPTSPRSLLSDSFQNLPGDENWSGVEGKMTLSPLHPRTTATTSTADIAFDHRRRMIRNNETPGVADTVRIGAKSDRLPLPPLAPELANVDKCVRPTEIMAKKGAPTSDNVSDTTVPLHWMDVIFKDIETHNFSVVSTSMKPGDFAASSFAAKAGHERLFSLLATCLVELPVLALLLGGSDHIRMQIGRHRYQLLTGFIPLVCAISGNMSLQANILMANAIFHKHLTAQSFGKWFKNEITTSTLLGFKMGIILGAFAFLASGNDFPFAITILLCQMISSVSAACTGTIAPILLAYLFRKNATRWTTGVVFALQDSVGCLTILLVSYCVFVLIAHSRDDNLLDSCGPVAINDDSTFVA